MSPLPKNKSPKTSTLMIPLLPPIPSSSTSTTARTTHKPNTTEHRISSTISSSSDLSSPSSSPNITSDSISSLSANSTDSQTPIPITLLTADNSSSVAAPIMVGAPSLQPIASQSSDSSVTAAIIGGAIIGAIFVFGLIFFTLRRTRLKQGGLRHFSVHPSIATAEIHSQNQRQELWEDVSSQNHLSGSNFSDPYHTSQLNIDQQPPSPSPPPPVAMVNHHNQNKTEFQRYVPQLNIPLPGTSEEEDDEKINPSYQYHDHQYQPEPVVPNAAPIPGRNGHPPHWRPPIPAEFVFPISPETRANEEDDEYGEAY